jgi:hypothetical protein
MPTTSLEDRANFITYAKSIIKSIQQSRAQEPNTSNSSRKGSTRAVRSTRSRYPAQATGYNRRRQHCNNLPTWETRRWPTATRWQPQNKPPPEVSIPWYALPPIEVRFANLLFRNPTLLDRASEYFDMEYAASGIRLLESSIVDEFVGTILSQYAETGYFSPQVL